MKKIINWGFIGLGNASLNLAKEFKNINNSNLLAVASHNDNKRKFYEQKFEIQKENPSKLNWMDNFLVEVTSIFLLFIVVFFKSCFIIRWRPISTCGNFI